LTEYEEKLLQLQSEKIAFEQRIMQEKLEFEKNLAIVMHTEKMKLIKAKCVYFQTLISKTIV